MNEALRKELEQYYFSDTYGRRKDSAEVQESHNACYRCMEPLRQDRETFSDLESAIADSEIKHELQGLLRGYEYCLTMLGLNH